MELGGDLTVAGTLLLFLIFALGVVSLQYCFGACYGRRDLASSSASQQRARRRRCRDGDPPVAPPPSLPAVTVYRAANKEGEAAAECAVCLAGLEDGEEARFMPCCGHGFHAQCVGTWLAMASRPTCPLCRIAVARPGVAPAHASTRTLPPIPSEPANYAATANLLVARLSDQRQSQGHEPIIPQHHGVVMVIEIPEDLPCQR
ncbi:unnamed protein product [Urochloa humidicola]